MLGPSHVSQQLSAFLSTLGEEKRDQSGGPGRPRISKDAAHARKAYRNVGDEQLRIHTYMQARYDHSWITRRLFISLLKREVS